MAKPLSEASYKCRHGLSYTVYECDYSNIKASQTLCVPIGDNLELWDVRAKNEGKETRDLQVFSYCEFSFHHIMIDNQNFQMSLYCAGSSCEDGIIEHDLFYEEFGYQYFTMSEKPDGFGCLRDKKGKEARAKYSDPKAVDKAYEALQSYWKNKLDKLQIHTPHNDAVCTVTE